MRSALFTALFAAFAVSAIACSPQLSVVTPAPPNRVVRLSSEADRIEVSEGVAIAVECYRDGGPCKDVRATVTNASIAQVFPAHMSRLSHSYYMDQGNVSSVAVVGLAPGKTTLRVTSEGWSHDYEIAVLPIAPAMQVAHAPK